MNRRKWITTGLSAAAGATGLAVAARLADRYGLIPPDCGGVYAPGRALTYASHRLLTSQSLAREFPSSQISKDPFAKLRPFDETEYKRVQQDGWNIEVNGMVAQPRSFSLSELQRLPVSSQITQLTCEEGWSFIAEWSGVALSHVLNTVGTLPQARYVVYFSAQKNWRESIDMADALHPQTLLVYQMNGNAISKGHGGPLRLRVPRQLGYKSVKFITRLTVTDSLERFKKGGTYSWYAGI